MDCDRFRHAGESWLRLAGQRLGELLPDRPIRTSGTLVDLCVQHWKGSYAFQWIRFLDVHSPLDELVDALTWLPDDLELSD